MTAGFSKLTWLRGLAGADLTPTEYRVLVAVFNYADASGCNAYPGTRKLAADCGTSTSTIDRALSALRSKGWLIQDYKGSGFAGKSSVYRLGDGTIPRTDAGNGEPPYTADLRDMDDPYAARVRVHTPHGCGSIYRTGAVPTDPLTDPGSDPKRSDPEVVQPPVAPPDQPGRIEGDPVGPRSVGLRPPSLGGPGLEARSGSDLGREGFALSPSEGDRNPIAIEEGWGYVAPSGSPNFRTKKRINPYADPFAPEWQTGYEQPQHNEIGVEQ